MLTSRLYSLSSVIHLIIYNAIDEVRAVSMFGLAPPSPHGKMLTAFDDAVTHESMAVGPKIALREHDFKVSIFRDALALILMTRHTLQPALL